MRKVKEAQHEYSYEAVEKLDELITTWMLCVEQECRENMRLLWSEKIDEKMKNKKGSNIRNCWKKK